MNPQSRAHRKPPDVEEALSSMLWTPYDNNISESDSSDETEALHRVNNNNSAGYSFFGTGANTDHHRRHQHQQSLMRRSLSAWSYRSRTGKPAPIGESEEARNRFSYPYYDQPELGFGAFGGDLSSGWYGYSSSITNNNDNNDNSHLSYSGGFHGSSYGYTGYGGPMTSSISSYSFQPSGGEYRRTADGQRAAPWQTLTVADDDRSNVEKRPTTYLQTPFVGRWQSGAAQLETSSLPYSLLALDSLSVTGGTTAAATATSIAGREADGFADSYQDDYQVYADNGNGERRVTAAPDSINNNNIDRTCSSNISVERPNDSLCIISAMLPRRTVTGDGGDLHFPTEPPNRWYGKGTTVGQHNSSITAQPSPYAAATGRDGIGVGHPSLARIPPQQATVEGDSVGPPVPCAVSPFNRVRRANVATSTSVRRADDGAQADRSVVDRGELNERQAGVVPSGGASVEVSDSPHQLPAMRLNVPAAGVAEGGSRTSVYIPSEEGPAGGPVAGASLPALTIQVNRLDPNNQQQNDVVNNAASGVSIVSCYRAAVPVPSVRQSVASGATSGPVENALASGDGPSGAKAPPEAASVQEGVNTSVANMATEQSMVQVSSADRLPKVDSRERKQCVSECGGVGGSGAGNASPGEISASPARTFTSTEAQTDDPIQQQPSASQPTAQQHPLLQQHPTAGFIGSSAPVEPLVTTLLGPPPGSEFSTREHRRRERRERRQARNRLQHIHPLEPPPPLQHRSPPPIEIIPDILHSHLPPPYTTLPMGASLIPQMIPANAVAAAAAAAIPVRAADDCRYTFPIPIMRSSPSERSRKGCCGHWFAGPPLRALIAVVALGGVACALGGAALGATGLAGSPTSHLTAALLMIGVGVILVTVSGAAWRMTAPGAPPCLGLGSTVDLGRCSRRPCGRGGSTPHGLLYPEFQHRPPPPSYQASMQEYRLRLLLLDRDRQSGRMRSTASPPPTYRSNVGSLLRIPLSSRYNNGSSNSIFGGISGIISGAVGGSSNSVNNVVVPPVPSGHPSADLLHVSSSPNPYGSDGHSTLPPSYRSVHQQPSPAGEQPSPQQPSPPGGNGGEPPGSCTVSDDAKHLISDANTQSTGPIGPNRTAAGVNHHAPSIIKIDERCTTMTVPDKRNSIPNVVALIEAAPAKVAKEEQPSEAKDAVTMEEKCTNGNSRLCPAGTVPTANSKDLVTIVTISGTIEPSGRSVYTSSNNQLAAGGAAGGATCTLLNSNSTPLLATVIPVSKSATTATTSSSAAPVGGSEPL